MPDREMYDEETQLRKLAQGYKGGNWFSNPVTLPTRTIVDGWPPDVRAKMKAKDFPTPTPTDPWNSRR